jgi:hypothetical protein
MTDQPGSARFQALLERAVQAYEEKAGAKLTDSGTSLATQLERCDSVDDIAELMRRQAQSFNYFREQDRILKSIKKTVSIVSPINSVASVGLVRRKELIACLLSERFDRHYSHKQGRYTLLSASY